MKSAWAAVYLNPSSLNTKEMSAHHTKYCISSISVESSCLGSANETSLRDKAKMVHCTVSHGTFLRTSDSGCYLPISVVYVASELASRPEELHLGRDIARSGLTPNLSTHVMKHGLRSRPTGKRDGDGVGVSHRANRMRPRLCKDVKALFMTGEEPHML